MKKTIDSQDFIQAFRDYNRQDNFSIDGLKALFEMFEEIDSDMELDVIAICCDYSESDAQDIADNHGIDLSDCADDEERFNTVVEYLQEETQVVYSDCDDDVIVYANF